MTKDEQIKELEHEIAQLSAQIEPLHERREQLKQQIIELKSPFKVGDKIRWVWGSSQTRMGTVVEITSWVCGTPKWKVRNIRKDGTEGDLVEVLEFDNPVLA